MNTWSSSL